MILSLTERLRLRFSMCLSALRFHFSDEPKPIARMLVLVKPKQAFIKWVRLHNDGLNLSAAEILREDRAAFLIPKIDEADHAGHELIDEYGIYFFEHMLSLEMPNEAHWPQNRTTDMFCQWFEVEFCDMVLDMHRGTLG